MSPETKQLCFPRYRQGREYAMILLNLFVWKVELPTKNTPAAVRYPTTIDNWTAEEASEEIAGALTVS
jgi:hypothetical protein